MRRSSLVYGWTMILAASCVAILEGAALFNEALAAEEYDEIKVSARIDPGAVPNEAKLRITATLIENWHIYSTSQPDGGPKRTIITLKPSSLFTAGSKFAPNHEPEVKFLPEFPGVPSEEHSGQVTWTNDLKLLPGVKLAEVAVAGSIDGQVCMENGACVPVKIDFAAVADGGTSPPNPLAPNPLVPNPLAPAPTEKTTPVAEPKGEEVHTSRTGNLSIRGEIRPASVAPGGKAELRIIAEPGAGFHVYAWAARDPQQSSKPTLIVVSEAGKLKFSAPKTESEIHTKTGEPGEPAVKYHEGAVTWVLPIDVPVDAKPGEVEIAGLVGAQVCTDKSCDSPEGAKFRGKLTIGEAKDGASPLLFMKAKYKEVDQAAANHLGYAISENDQLSSSGDLINAESSLTLVLGVALLGGFILNFMPCVLPVVGLKLLSFAKQAGQSRAQAFALNLAYAVGQLAVFLILATAAVTLNLAWGEHFSSVTFVVIMTAVVFAMSLSFLGVWEMPVPGFGAEDHVNELAEQEGFVGAFFQGVLTTILATPCSGPMLGAVFNFCVAQPPYVTFLVFTFLALGMSLPYLIIGLEPSLIRFLPKPGEWMNTFKNLVGFSMLAGVGLLVSFVHHSYTTATLEILVAVGVACWMIGKIPAGSSVSESWPTWAGGASVVAISAVVAFWLLGPSGVDIKWVEYSPPLANKLQKEGHTVMVDFTANWCLSCKYNKRWVIETPEVAQYIKQNGVVPVLADWTDGSEEIRKHLKELKSKSIPLLAIYPAGRPGEVKILRDVITQSQLLEALREAGPSQATASLNREDANVVMSGRE